MFLLEIMAISIGLGFLRRGTLRPLAQIRFRRLYLVFIALGIQVGIFSVWSEGLTRNAALKPALHLLSYFLIALVVWSNRQLPGFPLLGAGMLLNFLVISLNGGHMPANADNLAKIGYPEAAALLAGGQTVNNSVLLDSGTRLGYLSDIFYLPGPFPSPNIFSLGDVLIATGIFIFLQAAMRNTVTCGKQGGNM
ncbi:MAG: DUF5317 domain-containing protein [bacterium]|jgi:hypothetical protein